MRRRPFSDGSSAASRPADPRSRKSLQYLLFTFGIPCGYPSGSRVGRGARTVGSGLYDYPHSQRAGLAQDAHTARVTVTIEDLRRLGEALPGLGDALQDQDDRTLALVDRANLGPVR